jgi:transposase-like protein
LFDEYLDTLDKIEIWKKKVNYEKDFHSKKNKRDIVRVMIDTKMDISRKLYYLDSAITAQDNMTDIYLKIIETI